MPQFTRKQIMAIAKCIRNCDINQKQLNCVIKELDKLFLEDNPTYASKVFYNLAQYKQEDDPVTRYYSTKKE